MAYGVTPAEPRQRPSTVTTASYLLYLGAVVSVLGAINAFTVIGPTKRVMANAYKDVPGGDSVATVASIAGGVTAVIVLLFAVGYLVLGLFVGRGSRAARIVTWVVTGLSVCCGGFGLISSAGGMSSFGGRPQGAPDPAEVQRQLQEALPSWSRGVTLTLGVLNLLIAISVIVLLMLPASNEFFRKAPAQVWEPPAPSGPGSYGPPPAAGPGTSPGAPPPATGPPPGDAPPPPPA